MKSRLTLLLLALLPFAALATPENPVAGQDYEVIANGQPFAPLDGKVEVVEVFGYTCIHCAHFQPLVDEWKKKQPAYVRFTPVPAAFGGYWIPYARAYYAAESLGLVDRTHDAVFKALHEQGSLPIQNASAQEIAAFYAKYGADPAKFAAAMQSPATDAKLKRDTQFVVAAGVDGTPTVIVNGKYRVLGRSFEDILKITDALVAREHGTAAK